MMPSTKRPPVRRLGRVGLALAAALAVAACSSDTKVEGVYPEKRGSRVNPNPQAERETVFGPGGLQLFGGKKSDEESGGGGGIGVNSYLWRATLDTLSFMPLSSADPFGGVVITDWYILPDMPEERFKTQVYILDRRLRSDGIRVAVFRQVRAPDGSWREIGVSDRTAIEMEDAILTRARQLRIDAVGQ